MPLYTNNIAITIPGMVGLANNIGTFSTAINNTTTQFDEVDIEIKFKLGTTGVNTAGSVIIGVLGSNDGGVTYDSNMLSQNILETVTSFLANGRQYVTRVHLNDVPQFWKLGINNNSGVAFNSVSSNFNAFYTGIVNGKSSTLNSNQVNVGVTPTLLATSSNIRNGIIVTNTGAETVYLGPIGVTISTGFPLPVGDTLNLADFSNNAIYGVVPSMTSLASIMQW